MPKPTYGFMEFVDKNDVSDEPVTIPVAAVEYIEYRVKNSSCAPVFHFEVIEFFFEWLAMQSRVVQKEVLLAGLSDGRKTAGSGRSVS